MMRWSRRLPGLVPMTLGILVGGCSGQGDSAADTATRVPVGLAPVVRDTINTTLTLTGRLVTRPGGAVLLSAPAAGVIRTLRVQIADQVVRGEVIGDLDVPELVADARQKATAAVQAEREAARQKQLLADGITSDRAAEEAAAQADQARAAAAAASDLLARTRIATPITGDVSAVLVQRGERVEAGAPLVRIVAPDTLDLIVPVPAAELPRLHRGLPALVRQEGDTMPLPARVAAVAPAVDSLTNTGEVVVRVPNVAHRLRPGAPASAAIHLGRAVGVLVVPDSAIVLAGDSAVVFVVGPDSIAHQVVVRRGARAGGRSAVEGELRPGDRVVTTGAFGLQDGMHVVPAPPAPTRGDQ
jgi:RND family efflux transporter MFP subunit